MTPRQFKAGCFTLAGLNTLASSYFFNYLFFYLRQRFAFDDSQNLLISALHGLVYVVAAWQCGRFAERRGFLLSLKVGFIGLAACMAAAAFLDGGALFFVQVAAYTVVLLFTWPALEALVSEGEDRAGRQRMIGIYNCTWAAAAAIAYFTGGRLYEMLGAVAIFWIPAGIFLIQFALALWLEKNKPAATACAHDESAAPVTHDAAHDPARAKSFLRMAWLANPFAYIAINTLLAVMPGVADRLQLSPTNVGLFCSVWFFGRLAAFALFWQWAGWHYRFRWLLTAFVLLIANFAAILLAQKLWIVVAAQVAFGFATGLIYYSSLFYSMDVGETKGEHGGLHEAFIGAGIFIGPGVGAAALKMSPQNPDAGTWAVTALLLCGLGGLLWVRTRKQARTTD